MRSRRDFAPPAAGDHDPVADRVLADLRSHPIAGEASRAARERRREARLEHVAEIERLTGEEAAAIATANARVAAATVAVSDLRAKIAAADREVSAATDARQALSLSGRFSTAISRHRAELIDLAEPEITAFVEELSALRIAERSGIGATSLSEVLRPGRLNPFTGGRVAHLDTNLPTASRRADAILAAIRAAEAMRLDPDQADIVDRLAWLRASLPEVVSERATIDPTQRFILDQRSEQREERRRYREGPTIEVSR